MYVNFEYTHSIPLKTMKMVIFFVEKSKKIKREKKTKELKEMEQYFVV